MTGGLWSTKFDGIADEVLKHLGQQRTIRQNRWKFFAVNLRPALHDRRLQVLQPRLHYLIAIGELETISSATNPRKRQQILHQRLYPQRPVDGIVNVLVGFRVQFSTSPPAVGYKLPPCAAAPAGRGMLRRQTAPDHG
jgi:hypothetical protein